MKSTGIVRRIDYLGRIVIPKELRKNIFGRYDAEGAPMEFFINGQDIILRKYDEKSEDDVCGWKIDGAYLFAPHNNKPFVSCVKDEGYRYNYCPVCGKKIKGVE